MDQPDGSQNVGSPRAEQTDIRLSITGLSDIDEPLGQPLSMRRPKARLTRTGRGSTRLSTSELPGRLSNAGMPLTPGLMTPGLMTPGLSDMWSPSRQLSSVGYAPSVMSSASVVPIKGPLNSWYFIYVLIYLFNRQEKINLNILNPFKSILFTWQNFNMQGSGNTTPDLFAWSHLLYGQVNFSVYLSWKKV